MARARTKTRRRRPKQAELEFTRWGGPRRGAGRKPKGERAGVPHRTRAPLASRYPVHVTVRLRRGFPSLRRPRPYSALMRAFGAGRERGGFRLVHYSVQSNHMHLLVEAKDRHALTQGIQGLKVRVARVLNRIWRRTGPVFADRFHDRILRTPREVRNALAYVLLNARRHRIPGPSPDPYSSGHWFDGWRHRRALADDAGGIPPVSQPRTWLLATGWRRHGLLRLEEVPKGAPRGGQRRGAGSGGR